jgi:hypothetical protein
MVKTHMAKYLAPTFIVAQPSTKPKIATPFAMVMCQVRSLKWPDDIAHATENAPAIKYGGHVRTSVTSCEKPSVLTIVGMKFLKPAVAM